MKTLKFCSTAVLSGLVIGVLGGWHFGGVITKGRLIWEEMFASAGHGQLALVQYDQADPEHARQALLSDIDFSKSMAKLPSAQGDQALLIDMGRSYLKLAAIEDLAGNSALSHQYVLSAQESFRRIGRDIPEEKLNKEVTRIAALPQPASPPL
ncbi:MAG: hypothetical protein ABSF72_01640 [Candidatus Sulfotelmatobacter sp.]